MNPEPSLADSFGATPGQTSPWPPKGESSKQQPQPHYAGRARRLCAFFIDLSFVFFIFTFAAFLLGPHLKDDTSPFFAVSAFGLFTAQIIFPVAYFVGLTLLRGATLGKLFLGIRVVPASGEEKISLETVLLREIAGKLISLCTLGIGFLMIVWDKKRQGLHDKIAKTVVIRK